MGSSGGVEAKQKQNGKTPQHIKHAPLPPAAETLCWARAQASPMVPTVARTGNDQ